jgi:superfamily II DNA/RNA helicase
MTTFDLSPLWRSSVGFDEFDRLLTLYFLQIIRVIVSTLQYREAR